MKTSSLLNLILSIFLTVISATSYAGDGGSNGGGGNSTSRTPVSKEDLKQITILARKLARPNFMYVENNVFGDLEAFQPVIKKIKSAVQAKPNLFSSMRLFTSETTTCPKINGQTTVANYSNGIICFNLGMVDQFQYSRSEAEIKITALYLHEIAHAAGYTNSPLDEQLLLRFQKAVEKLLVFTDFTQQNYDSRLLNPLDSLYDFEPSFREKIQRVIQAPPNASKMWVCFKVEEIMNTLSYIPINNRQEAKGLSIMSSEDESLVDLLTWEAASQLSLNCDGLQDETPNISSIARSQKKVMSLQEAIININGANFCSADYEPKVCKTAMQTLMSTKPMSTVQFKAWSVQFSNKVMGFFNSPQFKF